MLNKRINDYDFIIVGAGIAGMTAAVRGQELGLNSLVIEQGDGVDYACNTRYSGGILHIGFLDPYRPYGDLTSIIKDKTAGETDTKLASAVAITGSRFLDWLKEKGARFVSFNQLEGYRWCVAPPRSMKAGIDWQGRGPDVVLRELVDRFRSNGGTFLLRTRGISLKMEKGSCVGLVAENDDGGVEWSSGHVLLADGGFQANQLLFERYIGADFRAVFQRGARTGKGDGLQMAIEAGAKITNMQRFYGHVLCRDAFYNDNVWPYPEIDAIATAGIVVNSKGQRVADEGQSGVYLTNMLALAASSGPLYAIFDAAIWKDPGCSARIPANPLLEQAGGTVYRAEKLEELAVLLNVPSSSLCDTVAEYNEAIDNGNLSKLTIPRSQFIPPWRILESPFMAIPICPGITYTMGGIATDEYAQVVNENGQPIPGLMAAGATTGGLEGGSKAAYIGGLIKSGVFGLISAERVASLHKNDVKRDRNTTGSVQPIQNFEKQQDNGLAKFPMLSFMLRFGNIGAVFISFFVFAIIFYLCWSDMNFIAFPIAAIGGLVVGIIALSFVELIRLITDLLLPR